MKRKTYSRKIFKCNNSITYKWFNEYLFQDCILSIRYSIYNPYNIYSNVSLTKTSRIITDKLYIKINDEIFS